MRERKCEQQGRVRATAPALAALLLLALCEGKNPGQPPECGNGVVDEAELCDGFNMAGETCLGLGLGSGALACQPDCRSYDLTGCEIQAECGNQGIEYPETCDGSDLDGITCADFGYYTGTLACLPDCSGFDLGGCAERCGDGVRNGPELCDGEDVGSESCEARGYYSGSLRCAAGCQGFDESVCSGYCGDGACDRAFMESFTSCPDDCPGYVAISAGYGTSCAVASDGTAWCWGYGALGNPSQFTSDTPMQVSNLTNAVAISAGADHSCAVASDGKAWCWGGNTWGQLGNGSTSPSYVPVQVSNLTNAVAISVGYMGGLYNEEHHSCAMASDGTAWCWGSGNRGRLGNGDSSDSSTPVAVSSLTSAVAISAAIEHSCAVTAQGTAWCWGDDRWGSLGQGEAIDGPSLVPVQVIGLTNAVTIDCGGWHCCVLASDGTAWCWGAGSGGDLSGSSTPVQVIGLSNVVAISSGVWHSCAVASDGTAWCWGAGYYGSLGDDSCSDHMAMPVQVSGLTNVVAISAGWDHSCAVVSDGTAWCWGENAVGQLGNGSTLNSCTPVQVQDLP